MTKIFKPLFGICLIACLLLSYDGWCAASRKDWKEQLIEKGRQQLLDTQLRNTQNDVRGESHLNSYVVLVSSSANAYPNSGYIQQKKGKRGREEIGDYMLTEDQLTRLNELLATYNSKSNISTYLLLVDHMPLDFIDVMPDEQTITDIINSKKSEENFTKDVTEQALEDARDIVESITAPLLDQIKSPTLYCGLVNFKVYKNEKEGKGFTIYYPRNSAINFDSQYRHMLSSFVSQQKSHQWANNYEKVSGIIEAIRLNNEEYGKIKGLFTDLTNIVDPKILFQKISSLSVNGLSSFDVDQRLHILKVLSSDGLNDDEETLALNIFKASPVRDAGEFLNGLKEANEFHGDKDALLNCLLGSTQDAIMGFWGEDNFQSLSNELVRLWSASVSLSSQYEAIVSSIPDDRIFYRGESSETRNGVNYRESSYLPSSIASNGQLSLQGFYKLELKGKVLAEEAVSVSETLDPFETIGLVFLSPPANDILGSAGTGKVIPLPAIAYHCYDTKAWTNAEQKTAIDIVQLASVAVAIGEIQSARQAWRVWMAWGDLAVNAPNFVLKNEQVRQQILALPGGGEFLFYWDRCVLIANGVYLSPFAYQFAKGLVSSSVRLSSQLPEIVGKQWQDVNNLFTKLDEGYELGLVGKVAKGAGKLAYNLTGTLKATFDDIVGAGIKYVDDGISIKFIDNAGGEIATIKDGKFTPSKWTLQRKSQGILISQTDEGYKLIKNGNDYAFELGYKEGRSLSAEEVNIFHKSVGNHEPYKPLTTTIERNLQPGDKIYIVEYANGGVPNPGGWGSKNQITSLREVREDLAILNDWKDWKKDKLVLREYTVKEPLPVRDGVVGSLQEISGPNKGTVYYGNQQQYEFIEYLGGEKWRDYLNTPIEHVLK